VSCALVVGSGSAGRRHAAALLARESGRRVLVVRRPDSTTPVEPLHALGVEVLPSLQQALEHEPTLAVVASPAPWHAHAATTLLDAGCCVMVEKPVVASLQAESTRRLRAHPHARDRLLVGYHLRFGDVLPRVAGWIRSGAIGSPLAARFTVGQHLGSWRPGTDADRGVSARAELGGGVLLELSHELDALTAVLDEPITVVAGCELRRDGAPTDGVVETVADLELRLRSGTRCSVHLDMTSRTPVRRWAIKGTEGTIDADLLTSRVELRRPDSAVDARSFPDGERDRAGRRLIAHLEDLAVQGVAPGCGIDDGLATVAVVEAARRSAAEACTIDVDRADRSAA
jgi:predicted dehydrogenase